MGTLGGVKQHALQSRNWFSTWADTRPILYLTCTCCPMLLPWWRPRCCVRPPLTDQRQDEESILLQPTRNGWNLASLKLSIFSAHIYRFSTVLRFTTELFNILKVQCWLASLFCTHSYVRRACSLTFGCHYWRSTIVRVAWQNLEGALISIALVYVYVRSYAMAPPCALSSHRRLGVHPRAASRSIPTKRFAPRESGSTRKIILFNTKSWE